jgi:hypothetical protein
MRHHGATTKLQARQSDGNLRQVTRGRTPICVIALEIFFNKQQEASMKNGISIIAVAFTLLGTANAALAQGLPRTPLLEPAPPAVTPYNPPAINSLSDRVIQSDQSFQLDRGLGNNPTGRDAYVRSQLGN